jgi:RimJ/RimL family protein N-acetyltransferase
MVINDISNVSLETQDLIMKKAKQEDWCDMYRNLWSHEESARYMLWDVTSSEEEAMERMKRTIAFEQKEKYALLVYEKSTGRAIGFAGMREIEPGVFEDIGIAIGPSFTHKGYGKQILNALMDEAFNKCGAHKFIATCREQNLPSHNLQMSCGFKFSHSEEKVDPRNGEKYIMECNEKII